jgi:hypothetical protein
MRKDSKIIESVGDFVVAGVAAGHAVKEAILAEANVGLGLAQAAVSFAVATVFGHFALHAAILVLGGGGHGGTVTLGWLPGKVPLVTALQGDANTGLQPQRTRRFTKEIARVLRSN